MTYKKIVLVHLLLIAILLIVFLFPKDLIAEDIVTSPTISNKDLSVIEMIENIAPTFNQDPNLIKKIIWCESGGKDLQHDGGHGQGVTGIHKKTFDYWLIAYEKEYNETLNYVSTYDQIKMMSFAFSKGYANQWTTFVAHKKGGEYTFYSRLMGKTYTAKCK
ncbi:hypothetical protein K9M47_03270 [Candidatus Gracilibacteria bacterium]|nr:hypothetical protein [Candidatus Gracilibacteria bacterium]